MGYAIFTARKLMLTNRINQLNFRILQLSQQQQTLSDKSARMEIATGNMRNLFSSIGNMLQMGLQTGQSNATTLYSQEIRARGLDPASVNPQELLTKLQPYTTAINGVSIWTQMNQEFIQQQAQAQLKQVKDMENNIELQRKSLETQLKAAQAEMQEVEKAEDQQIKNSAPKFG